MQICTTVIQPRFANRIVFLALLALRFRTGLAFLEMLFLIDTIILLSKESSVVSCAASRTYYRVMESPLDEHRDV